MGFGKQDKLARERRRNDVAAMYLRGASYREIAQALTAGGTPASRMMVKRDLDAIREEWAKERVADFEQAREDVRRRLLLVFREAAQEYYRSKKEAKRRTRKGERLKPIGDGEGNGNGRFAKETWDEESFETRLGDPAYLEVMRKVADQLAKIDGCYAPKRIEGSFAVGIQHIDRDPFAGLPLEQRREAVKRLTQYEQQLEDEYLGNGEAIDVPVIEHKEGEDDGPNQD